MGFDRFLHGVKKLILTQWNVLLFKTQQVYLFCQLTARGISSGVQRNSEFGQKTGNLSAQRHQTLNVVFRVYRLEIQSFMLVFSTPCVNYAPLTFSLVYPPPSPPPPKKRSIGLESISYFVHLSAAFLPSQRHIGLPILVDLTRCLNFYSY
jgi:hypothetical protein